VATTFYLQIPNGNFGHNQWTRGYLNSCEAIVGTDEQYVLYCIEIQYQKLGLYWYWLIFQDSTIPIPNQYQQKYQIKKTFQPTQYFIQILIAQKHNKQQFTSL
jgi:hypothetical protein